MKELEVAIRAAKESEKIINRYFDSSFRVERKADKSPVTKADKDAEKKIVSVIRKEFPDHNFLCEEFSYEKTDSEFTWLIDPIDGTKDFVRRVPFFGTFIALKKKNISIAGVVNLPKLGILAYAAKGKGAFVSGKRVKVSNIKKIEDSFLVFGNINKLYKQGYGSQLFQLAAKCERHRGFGQQLGTIFLAQGHVDINIETASNPWDLAAPKIIIEEAGGKVTDFEGNPEIHSGNYVATNGKLHEEVLKILNSD